MKVQRVERHIIKKSSENWEFLDQICFAAKNLHNYTTYILRQAFTGNHSNIKEYKDLIKNDKFISEYDLSTHFSKENQVDYRALRAQVAQQTIKLVYKNFNSFFKAIKAYKKSPSKFTGRPKLPKYKEKNSRAIAIYTNQSARIKNGEIYLSKTVKLNLKSRVKNFQQIRIIHKGYYIVVEVVYEKTLGEFAGKEDLQSYSMGIDLGVNNLATITSDNGMSLIINGRSLKSINQYYNKKLANLKTIYSKYNKKTGPVAQSLTLKRNNLISDYLHKASKLIVLLALRNNIKYCFVGLNKDWKQECNMSKKNNQNFIQIPFDKFVSMLKYKLEEQGIVLITLNESHTSKCSFLDGEDICHHSSYLGKRIKRGLFKSATGQVINADINGSLNILKRGLGKSFDICKSVFNPQKIKDIEKNLVNLRVI